MRVMPARAFPGRLAKIFRAAQAGTQDHRSGFKYNLTRYRRCPRIHQLARAEEMRQEREIARFYLQALADTLSRIAW